MIFKDDFMQSIFKAFKFRVKFDLILNSFDLIPMDVIWGRKVCVLGWGGHGANGAQLGGWEKGFGIGGTVGDF